MDQPVKIADELKKMEYEPLLPVEKRLIAWSIGLGIVLLGLLLWVSQGFSRIKPGYSRRVGQGRVNPWWGSQTAIVAVLTPRLNSLSHAAEAPPVTAVCSTHPTNSWIIPGLNQGLEMLQTSPASSNEPHSTDMTMSRGQRRTISITRRQSITPSPQPQPTGVPVTLPRSAWESPP